MTTLQPIDVDYIKTLRAAGKKAQANELLKAHKDNLIKQREQDKLEHTRYVRSIIRFKHICVSCKKRKADDGFKTCSFCYTKTKKFIKTKES